jgi:hypothetical protein
LVCQGIILQAKLEHIMKSRNAALAFAGIELACYR